MGWIGVDLDGTLAEYKKGQGSLIGRPLQPMVARIKKWQEKGKEVRIFTARAKTPGGVMQVQTWLANNGLPKLDVTNVKDDELFELWDDKAIRVVKNTGNPCSGCGEGNQFSAVHNAVLLTDC